MPDPTCPKDGGVLIRGSISQRNDIDSVWDVVTYTCSNPACGHTEQIEGTKREMKWFEADVRGLLGHF